MLRITTSHSAEAAKNYFDVALKTSDYYTKDIGTWGGKGAEILGLKGDVQRKDFVGLFQAMDGFPVVIRTLDPPLHEFLPKREDLMVDLAVLPYADARKKNPDLKANARSTMVLLKASLAQYALQRQGGLPQRVPAVDQRMALRARTRTNQPGQNQ